MVHSPYCRVVKLIGVAGAALVLAIAVAVMLGRPGLVAVLAPANGLLVALAHLAKVLLTAGAGPDAEKGPKRTKRRSRLDRS